MHDASTSVGCPLRQLDPLLPAGYAHRSVLIESSAGSAVLRRTKRLLVIWHALTEHQAADIARLTEV
jgi:hypothetical protein